MKAIDAAAKVAHEFNKTIVPRSYALTAEQLVTLSKMIAAEMTSRSTCAEHKRALVCPNCEARRRGKKGALATQKKFDKETRLKWARKGGRPVTRSDAQESSLNVANE